MKQTIIFPLLITITNIVIAGMIATAPSKKAIGSGLILIPLAPLIILLSVGICVAVYKSKFKMTTKRTIAIITSLVLTIPLILLVATDDGFTKIQTLDCGQNRSIVLSKTSFCDVICAFYYQVFVNKREVVSRSYIDISDSSDRLPYDIDELTHKVVTANDGQFVAVVSEELPYTPLVIHDFDTGKSCPGQCYTALRTRFETTLSEVGSIAKVKDRAYVSRVDFLNLCHSPIHDTHLANIEGLTKLRTLHLCDTQITDKGLKHLQSIENLRHLSLRNTAITDKGLPILQNLRQLKDGWIDVSGTHMTIDGVKALRQALPDTDVRW